MKTLLRVLAVAMAALFTVDAVVIAYKMRSEIVAKHSESL